MVGSIDATRQPQSQKFTAATARSGGFLAVPLRAIRDLGQASQALAGILAALRTDGKRTFRDQPSLARSSRLPVRTFRRHLATLERAKAVTVLRTANATNTTSLAESEADWMKEGFLPLPRSTDHLPWSERIVYGWIVYRSELSLDQATTEDSISRIRTALALSRRSVCNALQGLAHRGMISRECHLPGTHATTTLLPDVTHDPPPMSPALESPHSEPSIRGECSPLAASAPPVSPDVDPGPSAEVASPLVQKWPPPSAKVASPSTKKQIKKISGQNADRKNLRPEDLAHIVRRLWTRSGYSGNDGAIFWRLAALLHAGRISEHSVEDAIEGARQCHASNIPAYIRTLIRNRVRDFDSLAHSVRIMPTVPTEAPSMPQERTAGFRATFHTVEALDAPQCHRGG